MATVIPFDGLLTLRGHFTISKNLYFFSAEAIDTFDPFFVKFHMSHEFRTKLHDQNINSGVMG